MDFRTYRLVDNLQMYNDNVAGKILKWSRLLMVQVKSETLDAVGPITILSSLNDLKLACKTNGVHEGAAIWLFHLFTKKLGTAVLNDCPCLKPKKNRCRSR